MSSCKPQNLQYLWQSDPTSTNQCRLLKSVMSWGYFDQVNNVDFIKKIGIICFMKVKMKLTQLQL